MKPTLAAKYFILSENGNIWAFTEKPEFVNDTWNIFYGLSMNPELFSGDMIPGELYVRCFENLELIPRPVWIPGEDEPVMVRESDIDHWTHAYSSGKLDHRGWLLCYKDGKTEWSSEGNTENWSQWRKPQ